MSSQRRTALPDGRFDISTPASARGSVARAGHDDVSASDKAAVRRAANQAHGTSSDSSGFDRTTGEDHLTREEQLGRGEPPLPNRR